MHKSLKRILTFFIFLFGLASCEKGFHFCERTDGIRTNEIRTSLPFNGIHLNTSIDVFVTQGGEHKVQVVAASNLLELVETDVVDDILYISYSGVCVHKKSNITILVTAPIISSLSISGSGNITASSTIMSDEIALSTNGSGSILLPNLITDKCTLTSSGSGNITVSGDGSTAQEIVSISGSGHVTSSNLQADNVQVFSSGSGNASVYSTQLLEAYLSGSGNLHFQGFPEKIFSVTGTGKITPN